MLNVLTDTLKGGCRQLQSSQNHAVLKAGSLKGVDVKSGSAGFHIDMKGRIGNKLPFVGHHLYKTPQAPLSSIFRLGTLLDHT